MTTRSGAGRPRTDTITGMPKSVTLPPVRVDQEIRDGLEQIRRQRGAGNTSISDLIREAVADFIAKEEAGRRARVPRPESKPP